MRKSGYIIIEGNIGVGKSTFSALLAEEFQALGHRAEYLPEPDETTNPFLAAYYADPKANAYRMQMHLLHQRFKSTRYAQAAAIAGKGWYILDRSYYGDICFARVQVQDCYFTDAEYESYLDAHRNMREFIEPPTAAVFLWATPETCNRRICERARDCERGIDPAYLRAINGELRDLEHVLDARCHVISMSWEDDVSRDTLRTRARELAKSLLDLPRADWSF